jgi:hypothetical protein
MGRLKRHKKAEMESGRGLRSPFSMIFWEREFGEISWAKSMQNPDRSFDSPSPMLMISGKPARIFF